MNFQLERLEEGTAPKGVGQVWKKVKGPAIEFGKGFLEGFL